MTGTDWATGLGLVVDRTGYPRTVRHDNCGGLVIITGYIWETNEQVWRCARCGAS